jgi:pyridoxal phosphate enzyme (YggS family)
MRSDYSAKLKDIQSQLPSVTKLLIVSKTRPLEDIQAYYEIGHRDFGENRVQELLEKSAALKELCPDIRWHMIGHLQSNKINQLFSVHNLWAIHSVDDKDLLEKLIKAEHRLSQAVNIFLQYNTSREEEKSGFETVESLKEAIQLFPAHSKIKFYGLMTMGTLRTENFQDEARRCFQELNTIRDSLDSALSTSMGMSQDYQIALEERSNWVRLGTMMF